MITDFASLKTELNNFMVRNELDADLETIIQIGEATLRRKLRTMETEISANATLNGEGLAVPVDFRELVSIHLEADPKRVFRYVAPERMREIWAGSRSGIPRVYTITDGQFLFAPAPNEDTDICIIYRQDIPALSDGTPTNWLLDAHPDVYLFTCLAELGMFVSDVETATIWGVKSEAAVQDVIAEGIRKRMPGGRIRVIQHTQENLGINGLRGRQQWR